MKEIKIFVSNVLILVLIAAMALTLVSCGKSDTSNISVQSETNEKSFTFTVVDEDGTEKTFSVKTTEEFVGKALLNEGLIEGEDSQYGLMVNKVNGIVADYDTDGTYWAFYENGQYASSGVDTTKIKDGAVYSFKKQK